MYICGDLFRDQCSTVIDSLKWDGRTDELLIPEYCLVDNPSINMVAQWERPGRDNWLFIQSEYLPIFKIERPTTLVTHHSDINIDERHLPLLDHPIIKHWYAQNVLIEHPKLTPIPLGIQDIRIASRTLVEEIVNYHFDKTNLCYCNFRIETNAQQRQECFNQCGLPNKFIKNVTRLYMINTARSYFTVCPEGNGVDTHRIWEALYLKTIPIVTKRVCTDYFQTKVPMIVLDEWQNFNQLELSLKVYNDMWQDFDMSALTIEDFLK